MEHKTRNIKYKIITNNTVQTRKLGEKLAKKILKKEPSKTAFVIGLQGELGSGKTTFLQGFAKGLGIKEKILSPTFVIMKRFRIPSFKFQVGVPSGSFKFQDFYHIDCYRIQKPKELLNLNFKEIISNPKNIVAIEWSERIRKILPKNTIWIKFKFIDRNKRKITF